MKLYVHSTDLIKVFQRDVTKSYPYNFRRFLIGKKDAYFQVSLRWDLKSKQERKHALFGEESEREKRKLKKKEIPINFTINQL